MAKARALTEEGMTVYTLTSSYGYPPTTLTGSVERDIVLIPPMIGVKVAVSDHRSSNPGGAELIALATAARRAGLLSGTPGLVTMHMGSGKAKLDPISTYWITRMYRRRTCSRRICCAHQSSSTLA